MKDLARSDPSIIKYDEVCVDCGYSFRGLSTYGRCPECGIEVIKSIVRRRHSLSANQCMSKHGRRIFAIVSFASAFIGIVVYLVGHLVRGR